MKSNIFVCSVSLTYGAVCRRPAGQTFTVAVPGIACGVVDTVDTHFGTQFSIEASWTYCKTDVGWYKT